MTKASITDWREFEFEFELEQFEFEFKFPASSKTPKVSSQRRGTFEASSGPKCSTIDLRARTAPRF